VTFSLKAVRGVIFDVDGVLLDARPSYHAVAEEAARRALEPLIGKAAHEVPFDRAAEIPQFKSAGRFNDDWEMSRGIALLLYLRSLGQAPPLEEFLAGAQGRGVEGLYSKYPQLLLDPQQIVQICGSLYGGSKCRELFGFDPLPGTPAQGLWEKEVTLADQRLLDAVAARYPVALYTGRNPGEAKLALEIVKLKVPHELAWVADGRPRKPDPAGLVWLTHSLLKGAPKGSQVLFVGDTADDQAAARAAQDRGAPIVYAHVVEPGDTSKVLSRLLAESGEAHA
jgi:HAD superfamily phosphatase